MGRPLGSKNRRTKAREAALIEAQKKIGKELGGAFEGDAHALLMLVYKDPSQPIELRTDAAKSAIRYEKPALASTVVEHRDALSEMSYEDLVAVLARLDAAMVSGAVEEEPASLAAMIAQGRA